MPKAPSKLKSTADVHSSRVTRLRSLLTLAELDHLLITNPLDVAYLTGFLGGDSYLVVSHSASKPILISDSRYQEEVAPHAVQCKIVIRKAAMSAAVLDVAAGLKGKLGFQAEVMTVAESNSYLAAFKKAKLSVKLVAAPNLLTKLRVVKDALEIGHIKAAVKIQEKSLLAILKKAKAGRTEQEIAARLEAEMQTRGSREASFHSIVAAAANSSRPHYTPNHTKLVKNDLLLIDWGAVVEGYHSDMTRTFALGKWPKKMKEVYKVVREAHDLAAAALAPGKRTLDIDAIARNHIKAAGFGDYFGHGLGHGIGFNIHEEPRVSYMAGDTVLAAGHVVTIEPGIYLPGVGGVRLENDFAITEKGSECLCSLPMDIDWATL